MWLLLLVSIIWGFSFGLIKAEFSALSGATLATARLLIALPCFLPFLARSYLRINRVNAQLVLIGAVQYGLMYVALFAAFGYLSGYEVALLTVMTPLYVVMASALIEKKWPPVWFWLVALLAVTGAVILFRPTAFPDKLPGIGLMQISNLCFALGQVAYRHLKPRLPLQSDVRCYALLYIGGAATAALFTLGGQPFAELQQLNPGQWWALLYLGTIASGLAFFLWNAGAARVSTPTLAVFNNLKIPIAIAIAIVVFGESAHYPSLIPGAAILLGALAWSHWRAGIQK